MILCFKMTGQTSNPDYTGKTILAVFAHPDDELYAAPVLAKYAFLGAEVHLVVVTDGRYGTGQTDLKPGSELVELREKELDCSCENLGIEKPITLGYHDQLKLQEGFFGHVPYVQNLLKQLDSIVNKLDPDVMLTWGPDGGSNHMDHRIVGASVTQIYLNSYRNNSMKLYYVGTPIDNLDAEDRLLRGVDQNYLNVRIPYGSREIQKTISAVNCYTSQFSPEKMKSRAKSIQAGQSTVYLRELGVPEDIRSDFFE